MKKKATIKKNYPLNGRQSRHRPVPPGLQLPAARHDPEAAPNSFFALPDPAPNRNRIHLLERIPNPPIGQKFPLKNLVALSLRIQRVLLPKVPAASRQI